MIKNAIPYSVEMPGAFEMLEFVTKCEVVKEQVVEMFTAKKPSPQQQSSIGFTKHPVTGKHVSEFEGGYCLTILNWEKKIDNGAVNALVNDVVDTIEQRESRKLKRKEVTAIKNQVVTEHLPHVLPTPKYTFVYFHTASKTLIVDTTSDKTSDECTSLLRKALGSLKATTLYIDSRIGLTEQVANCIDEGEQFMIHPVESKHPISICNKLELNGGDTNGNLKFKDVDLFDETSAAEIVGQIREGGMYVKNIELEYTPNAVTFELTDGVKFKKFAFDGFEAAGEDSLTDWLAESLYCTSIIANITDTIVKHFTVVEE